jgi:hypothetical protein
MAEKKCLLYSYGNYLEQYTSQQFLQHKNYINEKAIWQLKQTNDQKERNRILNFLRSIYQYIIRFNFQRWLLQRKKRLLTLRKLRRLRRKRYQDDPNPTTHLMTSLPGIDCKSLKKIPFLPNKNQPRILAFHYEIQKKYSNEKYFPGNKFEGRSRSRASF